MTVTTFSVPKDHTLEEILRFGNRLASDSGAGREFRYDFQGKGLDTPFGMLYMGMAIRNFITRNPEAKHVPVNYRERGYAAHMGYFHTCGFDIGNLPGMAQGSDTYLPVTILDVSELKEEMRRDGREMGDVVEARSRKLAQVLAQQENDGLVDMLSYTLREMIRNVVEHSGSAFVGYCAQYMPKKKQAEIAILDGGMGVQASLKKNPYLEIKDDHDALNLALMPGVSGKMFKGVKRDPYDVWQNSGYGLYAISRLCGHGGKFTICSGETALTLKPDKKEYHSILFQGVALRIVLSMKEIQKNKVTLAQIMKEGDKQAKELGISGAHPSAASRMLSVEFGKKE